ncbi:E3 ubiquitin- ligase AMFR-like [Brachionus plicatilis]|uniref:E3 ubiquitin-ligase AMFR-like n=1 Tax=Brachionus plicatilis TaxID=10195 RepID=A0A3M7T4T4_BRAPC|nr:E3 ubiquitin- ligase AMFR-like [Brachionus plicatilis]
MIIFLKKLPIPNLKHYCLFSLSLLCIVFIYVNKLIHDIRSKEDNEDEGHLKNEKLEEKDFVKNKSKLSFYELGYNEIMNEPWCVWVLINFCYCVLIIIGKILQNIFFGKLRALERQRIKDQFWNFMFLKFIFIFGVLNLDNIYQVVIWCTWFSIIGFLSIHCQICKDRFEYLSFSAATPLKNHAKLISLLVFINITCIYLLYASFFHYKLADLPSGQRLFLFSEAFVLALRSLYVISKYSIHIVDIYNLVQLNHKGTIQYYLDFVFELFVISADLLNYLHMLIYGNFYLSMASLVICMEIKRLVIDLQKRMKRHSNYLKILDKMEKKIPWATQEELNLNDNTCAVCWEIMERARRLPCSHMFHHNCLRSWLEQDTSCPTCRKSLQENKDPVQTDGQNGARTTTRQARSRNLFQFNGSRYFRWLPNFSLQVISQNDLFSNFMRNQTIDSERLNEMTNQVFQMFPNTPIEQIQNDLRQTNSVELTIENILENRVNLVQETNVVQDVSDSSEDDRSNGSNQNDDEESTNFIRQRYQRLINFESNVDQNSDLSSTSSNPITRNLFSIDAKKRELLLNSKKRFLEKQNATEAEKKYRKSVNN